MLFNFHRAAATAKSVVVVVEGFFDCLRLYQAGVRSVIALMGSALYPSQQHMVRERFPRVILMLDGDNAGRRATAEIAAQPRPHCSVQNVHLPDLMQPDQMSTDQIRRALAACQPVQTAGQIH